MDENLKKLEAILSIVDTKTNADELVQAFGFAIDFIKKSNDTTAEVLAEIFKRLDEFAAKLQGDSEQDRKQGELNTEIIKYKLERADFEQKLHKIVKLFQGFLCILGFKF